MENSTKKHNKLNQQQIDDIIYVAGRFSEEYLKKEFHKLINNDDEFLYYIEKLIDNKEETAQYLSINKNKFNNYIKDFKNKSVIRKEFVNYINSLYPNIKLK